MTRKEDETEVMAFIQTVVSGCIAEKRPSGSIEHILAQGSKTWETTLHLTAAAASWNFYFLIGYFMAYLFWGAITAFTSTETNPVLILAGLAGLFVAVLFCMAAAKRLCNFAYLPLQTLIVLLMLLCMDIVILCYFGWWGIPIVLPLLITVLAIIRWGGYKKWFEHLARRIKKYSEGD